MQSSRVPGTIKKFRGTAWKFQETFQTPLKDLHRFSQTVIAALPDFRSARVVVEGTVFEPTNLRTLLGDRWLDGGLQRDSVIEASGKEEGAAMLEAAFGDWMDFAFIPDPKPFSIYADHDEYTTFFAQSRGNLKRLCSGLEQQGFKIVDGWKRRF